MSYLSIILHLLYVECTFALYCSSLHGDTPWYLMIKPPRSTNLIYADAKKPFLKHHDVEISSNTNPVAITMRPVYYPELADSSLNYFMFNDEVPGGQVSYNHGHTKGMVMFDNSSIVYLIHSTPHFPFNDSYGYGFPHTGIYYGQHFFCITMPISQLSVLLFQIRMMWPFVYNHKVSDKMMATFPDLKGIIDGVPLMARGDQTYSIARLTLVDGTNLDAFNKNGTFGADLYDSLICPSVDPPLNLFTETWQNGRGKLHSNCTANYFVKNIVRMNFFAEHLNFKETQDHSKWAMSADDSYHYLCFGGVNRMHSQFYRGGGSFCFFQEELWKFMFLSVVQVEECQSQL